jgi:diaminopimelate epimerase
MTSKKLNFIKMQGAGNDYIYIDCIKENHDLDWQSLSKKLSDRHFGVGSDGLVLIIPSNIADCRMRMFNADGSESQTCGNALRCIAKYVYENGYTSGENITIQTIPGIVKARINLMDSTIVSVSIELLKPLFDASNLPEQAKNGPMIDFPLKIDGSIYNISCVSLGNPHAVLFVEELSDELVMKVGPKIENHSIFPERTNVEFVKVENRNKIKVRVWERGSGETLACGSGASAAGVISIYTKKTNEKIEILMHGGLLVVEWMGGNVILTGPAKEVFRGEIEI